MAAFRLVAVVSNSRAYLVKRNKVMPVKSTPEHKRQLNGNELLFPVASFVFLIKCLHQRINAGGSEIQGHYDSYRKQFSIMGTHDLLQVIFNSSKGGNRH